jgi:NADH:ubiquinone reductase (H+-translocating)
VQVGRIKFGGFVAWAAWLFVHIFYLIGFKNKIFVFWQWAWSYITFKRGARLIIDKEWRSKPTR